MLEPEQRRCLPFKFYYICFLKNYDCTMKDQDLERNPWTTLKTECVYESPWVKVDKHDVLNPSGNPGEYSVIHFKNIALGILALDEDYNTWIVGQYRYALNQFSWEIPEGGGKLDVAPLESAKRELLEETGIQAQDWLMIQQMHLSNSVSDERAIIYLARNLSFGASQPEETEELHVKKLPFEELYQMVLKGEITDSMSVAGVLKTKLLMLEGLI
jgi:ADP-ribose pyrophosphatase